jgi:hypothetical protein
VVFALVAILCGGIAIYLLGDKGPEMPQRKFKDMRIQEARKKDKKKPGPPQAPPKAPIQYFVWGDDAKLPMMKMTPDQEKKLKKMLDLNKKVH